MPNHGRDVRFATPNAVAILICAGALGYLFSGYLRPAELAVPRLSFLAPEQGNEILTVKDGFADDAVYSGVVPSRIGKYLRRWGSWTNGDSATGKAQTAWFRRVPAFAIEVAGNPAGHDCELYVEAETAGGLIKRIPIVGDNPMETWQVREVSLKGVENVKRFRIIATDGSARPGGWIGFSQPFRFVHNRSELWRELEQLLLCVLTACAALAAMLFPGIWLRRRRSRLAFIWVPLPGFLILAAVGVLCWLEGRSISQWFLGPLFVYALYHSLRFPLTSFTNKTERIVLLTVLLLAALGIGQATFSLGPVGELFAGRISRTLQVGDRSDSRIPYHVLQLVAAQSRPDDALSVLLFGDWTFSARPPLVALAAAPIVLALPFQLPQTVPDQNWTVFDPEGFAAYRIAMIVIASCSLTAVFGVALLFLDEAWALLGFLVTATAPFVVHEIYFTWPKLEAAWFLFLAVYLITRRQCVWAGLLWGVAYLCHPLALLFAPALLAVVCLTARKKVRGVVSLVPGLLFCMALWVLANRGHFKQGVFLPYVLMADGGYAPDLTVWLRSRWISLANTFIPLYLFLLHANHNLINSVFGPSPSVVRFYFSYWNTLPFAVGITYFFFMLRYLVSSLWLCAARQWLLWVFVSPMLCFTVYWGAGSMGMLREGLHPAVLGLLLFSVVLWRRMAPGRAALSKACSVGLLLRGVETLLMLQLPSIWTSRMFVSSQFLFSDCLALAAIIVCVGYLTSLTFRQARLVSELDILQTGI